MRKLSTLTLPIFLYACANVNMVPHDVAMVDFDAPEGKTGWSQYQHVETFHGYTSDQIYDAAKVALVICRKRTKLNDFTNRRPYSRRSYTYS